MFVTITVLIAVALLGVGIGLWLGYRLCESDAEAERERLLRLDPPPRTPGQPTNSGEPSSRVVKARRRNGKIHDVPTRYDEPRR